jgi:hypothetical protein
LGDGGYRQPSIIAFVRERRVRKSKRRHSKSRSPGDSASAVGGSPFGIKSGAPIGAAGANPRIGAPTVTEVEPLLRMLGCFERVAQVTLHSKQLRHLNRRVICYMTHHLLHAKIDTSSPHIRYHPHCAVSPQSWLFTAKR